MPSIFRFSGLIAARRDDPESAETVTALHPFDTTLGVNHPLFSSVEGVTLTTHLDTDCWPSSAGLKHVTAGTRNRGVVKIRVNFFFHL